MNYAVVSSPLNKPVFPQQPEERVFDADRARLKRQIAGGTWITAQRTGTEKRRLTIMTRPLNEPAVEFADPISDESVVVLEFADVEKSTMSRRLINWGVIAQHRFEHVDFREHDGQRDGNRS